MSFKTVVNKSGKILSVIDNGRQVLLQADSTSVFSDNIVNAFVNKFGTDAVQVLNVADVLPDEVKEVTRDTWFANVTGNPDAPDTYTDADIKDKDGRPSVVKNPFKAPRSFYAQMKGSMVFAGGRSEDDFHWARPDGAPGVYTSIAIEPYKITKVTPEIGQWLKRRMGNSRVRDVSTGQDLTHLVTSREPPSFRPTLDWSLEDIKYYLILAKPEYDQVVDEKVKLGPSEAQIATYTKRDNLDFEQRLYEAKEDLLKRVFFLIADPKVPLPTQAEFTEFKQYRDSKKKKAEAPAPIVEEAVQAVIGE